MTVFRRFYRVRPLAALLLCLPGLLLCIWYCWIAYLGHDRYRRVSGQDIPLTIEDFHISLFDVLHKDLRRMSMPPAPDPATIELFKFRMDSDEMDTLYRGMHRESKRPYARAQLEKNGGLLDVDIRIRGNRHWHLLGEQKSFKVRLSRGDLLNGHRVFNLINLPTPMVAEEQIILEISRELGVLTPNSSYARVHLNGADLGVYFFEAQPDESLLRLNRRMPGSIYSGNLPPSGQTEELWRDVKRWKKVAWSSQENQKDYSNLKRLLTHINSASIEQFARFARREIDMQKFAAFDALDVVFGGSQHDYRQNHKYYFDPYRGRFEPVAWNFRGFKHAPQLNLVENPLLLRLKLVPEYLSLRNRIVYELLVGTCSVSSVRGRGLNILKELVPELASDPYWDAYKLLPRVSAFHRQMVRPMNTDRLALVFESEMTTFKQRHGFLKGELQRNPLYLRLGTEAKPNALQLIVDGRAGVRLTGFRARWPKSCTQPEWEVLQDGQSVTKVSIGDQAVLIRPLDLYPGVSLIERPDANPKRGSVRVVASPVSYPFLLRCNCPPEHFEAEGIHLATQSRIRSRTASQDLLDRLPVSRLRPEDVPGLLPGDTSVHPWELQIPKAETIHLGPGLVTLTETAVYAEHQAVKIAPGTLLAMGTNASLIFYGPVVFQGTSNEPIVVEGLNGNSWGGIILQGGSTAGSSLQHVQVSGGTRPRFGPIAYPGMLNIHDTEDITLRGCRFTAAGPPGNDDMLHVAYVKDLSVRDVAIVGAAVDALDLEFTNAELRRVEIAQAGDDGVDLMGSTVTLVDSTVIGCRGNAVSAGEETELMVLDSLLAGSGVGVLAKNAAKVNLSDSLLFGNQTGIRVYQKTVRYQGESQVQADVLYVVGSKKDVERKDRPGNFLDRGHIQRRLPRVGTLDHLARDVLGLSSFEGLARRFNGGGP